MSSALQKEAGLGGRAGRQGRCGTPTPDADAQKPGALGLVGASAAAFSRAPRGMPAVLGRGVPCRAGAGLQQAGCRVLLPAGLQAGGLEQLGSTFLTLPRPRKALGLTFGFFVLHHHHPVLQQFQSSSSIFKNIPKSYHLAAIFIQFQFSSVAQS